MDEKSETTVLLGSYDRNSSFSRKDITIEEHELQAQRDEDDIDLVSCLVAELVSCFMLIFLGLGAVYSSAIVTFDVVTTDRVLYIALAYGMVFSACIYAFSYPAADSRAVPNIRHLNPAMTLVLLLTGRFGIGKTILYWIAQVTGAGLAVISIYYCTPLSKTDIHTAYPLLDGVQTWQMWLMEFVVSIMVLFALLMTNFAAVAWKKQPSIRSRVDEDTQLTNHELNSLTSGFIIFAAIFAAGPISGGYVNPLFGLGIGILNGTYKASSLVAPLAAVVVALLFGLIYGFKFDWGVRRLWERRNKNK